jgi:hypothetical protein
MLAQCRELSVVAALMATAEAIEDVDEVVRDLIGRRF